ncbi:MAG: DUF5610 domain-containing protein, partial [Comamonadaceae bacterium]|nr:DUF5610 domain-containing protein [Comamonadaceae bacterium]
SAAGAANATTAQATPLDEARKAAANTPDGQRTQLNAQILQASMDVSIKAGDDSMALLYRTAIDHINELLAPEFGPDALQAAMQQDNSAEATAGRILSAATGFFDAYAARYPDKDAETVLRDFVDLVRGGFEKGYGEAHEILKGLGVLGEGSEVAAGIQKTFDLVQKGFDDFLATKLAALQPKDDTQAPADDANAAPPPQAAAPAAAAAA